jgi:hypothetical protein
MDLSRKAYLIQCTQHKIDEYTQFVELAPTPDLKAAYALILQVHKATMANQKAELVLMLSELNKPIETT